MSKLYVLGGRQRRPGLKEPNAATEWFLYEAALIVEVNTGSGEVQTRVEHQTPEELLPGEKPSAHFHSGTLIGDTLYTCSTTEVLIYKLPEFKRIGYISLPCFNDLHHVTPSSDGNLLIVSTGLDLVMKVS